MKMIFYFMAFTYALNVALYVDFMTGISAQFFLGAIHVFTALLMLIQYQRLTKRLRAHILIYTSLVILYFIVFFGLKDSTNQWAVFFELPYATVVPMLIGGYFVVITYLLQNGFI